jgi:hypothetical protein
MLENQQYEAANPPISSLVPEESALTPYYTDPIVIVALDEVSAETPEDDSPDPDAFIYEPIVASNSATKEEVEAVVADLFDKIVAELNRGRRGWFEQGKLFEQLHEERAVHGHGTYCADVERLAAELDISTRTIERRRKFYLGVVAGRLDLTDSRLRQNGEDGWEFEGVGDDMEAAEKMEADEAAFARKAKLAHLAAQAQKRREQNKGIVASTKIMITGLTLPKKVMLEGALKGWKNFASAEEISVTIAAFIIETVTKGPANNPNLVPALAAAASTQEEDNA